MLQGGFLACSALLASTCWREQAKRTFGRHGRIVRQSVEWRCDGLNDRLT
jgi:hypothetical protein